MTCLEAIKPLGSDWACSNLDAVGQGARGTAFQVSNKVNRKEGILKIVKPTTADETKALETELGVLGSIAHPNVIQLLGSAQVGNLYYEILELGSKGNLEKFFRKYSKDFKNQVLAMQFFRQIVEGVGAIHAAGFVHADLKPLNIVVNKDDIPKIIDFDNSVPLFSKSTARGTPSYLDPQMCKDLTAKITFTPAVDVWGLGIILYQLFHDLKKPFSGFSEKDFYYAINQGQYRIAMGVEVNVAVLITSMLQDEPTDRPSIRSILADIDAFLGLTTHRYIKGQNVSTKSQYSADDFSIYKTNQLGRASSSLIRRRLADRVDAAEQKSTGDWTVKTGPLGTVLLGALVAGQLVAVVWALWAVLARRSGPKQEDAVQLALT